MYVINAHHNYVHAKTIVKRLLLCSHTVREMAVKFNDYFEFPKEFDIAPYTAATLAKVEGE